MKNQKIEICLGCGNPEDHCSCEPMEVFLCFVCFEGETELIGVFDSMEKAVEKIEDYYSDADSSLDPQETTNLRMLSLEDCGWFIESAKIE